jgi:methylenetetrahydrofolate dehydrogenase (NADP+)/methenyltetrahydrofolate cyclohydrolase
VGQNPSSLIYVSNKIKTAAKLGIEAKIYHFDEETQTTELLLELEKLNFDPEITGILVQLPLPGHIPPRDILDIVDPLKDVDGLHPLNMGMFYEGDEKSALLPCTPQGCIHLIESSGIKIEGKKALVMGKSLIVGKPLSLMLSSRGATVTMAHSKTVDLKSEVQNAQIVISAVGKPGLVQGDWIQKGAVIIDVGMTRLDSGKVVGDVDFDGAKDKALAITPVPGGVGPMTIAYLMKNILKAKKLQMSKER